MHVLRAIRWGISAWENDVTSTTIQNCWARSQCIDFGQFPQPLSDLWTESQELIDSIRQGLYRMRQSGFITEVPNINDYISPYAEQVIDDCPETLVDDIIAQYTQINAEVDEDEGEVVVQELVKHNEALSTLHILRRYEEQNQFGNLDLLKVLRYQEREISSRLFKSREQVTLDQWFVRA